MPVEAAKPPIKTNSARASFPLASGRAITIMSEGVDAGRMARPANTIGTITREVSRR